MMSLGLDVCHTWGRRNESVKGNLRTDPGSGWRCLVLASGRPPIAGTGPRRHLGRAPCKRRFGRLDRVRRHDRGCRRGSDRADRDCASLAGFSAPLVYGRIPVELHVLLNAMIPLPGETGDEWWSNTGQQDAMHAHLAALGLPLEAVDDDTTVYFHDVSPEVSAQAFRRGEPEQSWTPMTQPW